MGITEREGKQKGGKRKIWKNWGFVRIFFKTLSSLYTAHCSHMCQK